MYVWMTGLDHPVKLNSVLIEVIICYKLIDFILLTVLTLRNNRFDDFRKYGNSSVLILWLAILKILVFVICSLTILVWVKLAALLTTLWLKSTFLNFWKFWIHAAEYLLESMNNFSIKLIDFVICILQCSWNSIAELWLRSFSFE